MSQLFANWLQSKAIAFNKIALQRIFKRRVKMFKSSYRRPLPLLYDIDPEPVLRPKQRTYWEIIFRDLLKCGDQAAKRKQFNAKKNNINL